ncbi:MAG TPA: helix-turn-helix transcriptional regulator [Solirubrobacterales bacterium]
MSTLAPTTAHGLDALVERASAAEGVGELFRSAAERLRRLVPFDGAVWVATDPATSLPSAPTITVNMGEPSRSMSRGECMALWQREFQELDVIPYRELVEAETPVGALRMATRGRPTRSPRYRQMLKWKGFEDELRAAFRANGQAWGLLSLFREDVGAPFDASELDLVAKLSDPLGEAIRAQWLRGSAPQGEQQGPGLMLLSPDGDLISANDEALGWLEEMPPDPWNRCLVNVGGDLERQLPLVVFSTLSRARTGAVAGERGTARVRLRTATGRWVICHASCMSTPGGGVGNTALVIEPAKGSEIAPIIVEAYELSAREREITVLIARGIGTAEIAERLFLSAHTVRDHVKAIFEKVGVSSRGELVARLFAEHYAPVHFASDAHQGI